jgi:mRNA interferase RelE/StbE
MFKISFNFNISKSKIPKEILIKIKEKCMELANDPTPMNCKKLRASDIYRVIVSDYRILYRVNYKTKNIFIERIAHRKEAY